MPHFPLEPDSGLELFSICGRRSVLRAKGQCPVQCTLRGCQRPVTSTDCDGRVPVPLMPPVKEEIQGTTTHGRWEGSRGSSPFCFVPRQTGRTATPPTLEQCASSHRDVIFSRLTRFS
jgi:hypothetical protein